MCPPLDDQPETSQVPTPGKTDDSSADHDGAKDMAPADCCCKETQDANAQKAPCCCDGGVKICGFRPPALMYTLFSLMVIVFGLWVVFTWSGYASRYSQVTEGWTLGSTKMIEITLIKQDKENLACASNLSFEGHRCGYGENRLPAAGGVDEAHLLSPYNTIKNELFIASNLWSSLGLKELPTERFTVVCNFHVLGVAKSMALRWQKTGGFDPLKHSVAVGTLNNCVIPQ